MDRTKHTRIGKGEPGREAEGGDLARSHQYETECRQAPMAVCGGCRR